MSTTEVKSTIGEERTDRSRESRAETAPSERTRTRQSADDPKPPPDGNRGASRSRKDEAIDAYRELLDRLLRSLEKMPDSVWGTRAPIEEVRALDRALAEYAARPRTETGSEGELERIRERTRRIGAEGVPIGSDGEDPARHPSPGPARASRRRAWLLRLSRFAPSVALRGAQALRAVWLLKRTPLFDRRFYRRKYPDVGSSDPEWHYYRVGAAERRDPSPFFSTSYYLEHNKDVASTGVNPLVHYIRRGVWEGRDPSLIFETRHYMSLNPDIVRSGLNPLCHFVQYGMFEGRVAMSPPKIHSLIGPYKGGTRSSCMDYLVGLGKGTTGAETRARRDALRVGVYCNTGGNYFYRDIRDLLVAGLERAGVDVLALDEGSVAGDRTHHIIVAPQEFFYLGQGRNWATDPRVDEAVLLSADQPHTPWFSRCLPYLFRARLVLDINYQVAATLRDLGVPAHFFPLGPLEGFEPFDRHHPLPDDAPLEALPRAVREAHSSTRLSFDERPIDLLFVATMNERRERFLARNAPLLSRHRCFLHLASSSAPPLVEGRSAQLSSKAVVGLCQRSKILLNVHRDDVQYFEWHRIAVLGLWQRALVITETSFRVPWLEPGKHYLEANVEDLPELVDWTLRSSEGRQKAEEASAAGHEALTRRYAFDLVIDRMVDHLL